ncbi:MAG: phage major capsid protein [Brevundimonas sp.]|nr:MAG: phage major capsid protein [Brevundimonas sp.]
MTTETKSAAELAEELKAQIKTQTEEVGNRASEALEEAKKAGAISEETRKTAGEALTAINGMREQLAQVEQKMARRPGQDEDEIKSYGRQFAESDKFEAYKAKGFDGSVRFAFKAITAAQSGTAWTARDTDVVDMPRRRMTIRDLLDVVPTTSGSIDYARQTTRTNAAAPVAEGAAKPYSAYVWEQVNTPVRTIAHLAKITRQAMDDAVQLQGEVESEMRYGLFYAEEDQLLNGDGTGQNIDGLIANATAYSAPFDPAGTETIVDIVFLGMLQAELALYPADGVVLNTSDWGRVRLLKDTAGAYLFGGPQGTDAPRLWGAPVVATPAIAVDKFLVGGFQQQRLYDRMAPEVLISSENVDDFEKNLYTMRCEERVALAVRKPAALIYGDLGNVA